MHERYMRLALALAERAAQSGEVPIGAVVVQGGEVLGEGYNQPVATHDPTAHAEIVALRVAAERLGNYRLPGTTLYVTVEPCLMCVGAMVHARVDTVVFGTIEPKSGSLESVARAHELPGLNHRLVVVSGVLAGECRGLMQAFFQARRRDA